MIGDHRRGGLRPQTYTDWGGSPTSEKLYIRSMAKFKLTVFDTFYSDTDGLMY